MKSRQDNARRQEIADRIVIAQAGDESAWEPPIPVRRAKAASLTLPKELAARAAFFARVHRSANVADWVSRVIKERLDIEEAAFGAVKRGIKSKCKA